MIVFKSGLGYNRRYKDIKIRSNTKEYAIANSSKEKVIFFHGFEREDVFKIIKAIKASASNPKEIAFSMSTPTNLEWKIKDMVTEVREDHAFFKEQEKKKKENK